MLIPGCMTELVINDCEIDNLCINGGMGSFVRFSATIVGAGAAASLLVSAVGVLL